MPAVKTTLADEFKRRPQPMHSIFAQNGEAVA